MTGEGLVMGIVVSQLALAGDRRAL
jgi:hypothetical protein